MMDTEKQALLFEHYERRKSSKSKRPKLSKPSRKTYIIATICLSAFIVLVPLLNIACRAALGHWSEDTYLSAAERVLSANPLIDGHNDFLFMLRFAFGNHINTPEFKNAFEKGGLPLHVDLPRLSEGKVGGSFWSAFMICPANVSDFSNEAYAPGLTPSQVVRATLEQLDTYHRLSAMYPQVFTPTRDANEAMQAFKTGKLISPIGIEGLHQIGNSISTLRLYYQLGVRYATLTWNCHNNYADAAVIGDHAAEPYWGGVSPAGRDLILEMNRMGMLVDISHVHANTMRDVLGGNSAWNGSIAPPIFSHSSAYAICPHPRNVPDDVLHLLKERKGLVMVNFAPDFISCKASNSSTGMPEFVEKTNTLAHVVKHIMYIGELIGYDHVGLGTDYDGIPSTPRGLEDVSKFPDLVAELLKQGVSEKDAGKIVGRNLLRVWKAADEVAAKLQQELDPLEDEVENPFGLEVLQDGGARSMPWSA